MKTIYKYKVKYKLTNTIEVPVASMVLAAKCVDLDSEVSLWIEVDPETELGMVKVLVVGTGWDLPEDIDLYEYVDTCIDPGGFVWHVYVQRI